MKRFYETRCMVYRRKIFLFFKYIQQMSLIKKNINEMRERIAIKIAVLESCVTGSLSRVLFTHYSSLVANRIGLSKLLYNH